MKRIFLAPDARSMAEIFNSSDLERLRTLGDLVIHEEAEVAEDVFATQVATADAIIGQIDLPESRLKRIPSLRATIIVEGNFLPNVDYQYCFRRGVRVLTISPVFAEPVAELAPGLAIDLGRAITRSDQAFSSGTEKHRLDAKQEVHSLFHRPVGLVGFGDLVKALLPLLIPFHCRVRVYDPSPTPSCVNSVSPLHVGIKTRKVNRTIRILTVNLELPNDGGNRILGNFHNA
jgi:phosphoglycerate dehydrogenase-like enzyme